MKKILVVDDDKHIRQLLTEELEDEGYQVVTASNGHEAISSVLRSEHPDLMIMDLRMPKMDGLDTIGNMLKLKIDVPVIIYTAYLSYKKNYLAMAADAYVMKSSDLTELKDKVHQLINAHDKDNEKSLHSYRLQANIKR
jgi:CheY-like chemotaxis protein